MGLMDKLKGLFKGRETQVKSGIDTVSDQVEKRAGSHAAKVDAVSDKAKEAVDKIAGSGEAAPETPPTPPPVTPPPAATPPAEPPQTSTPPAATPPPTSTPPA